MDISKRKITRREMLRLTALGGLVGAFLPGSTRAAEPENPALPQVPRRVLGKTKQEIPILLMGMSMRFDQTFDPKLAECLRFGVNYFDAADCYAGGTSETALGNFLERSQQRNNVWITTKSDAHDPIGLERTLDVSLRRLKTDRVDLMFMHALNDPRFLNNDMAKMADKLKNQGKIHFFGFSCHDGTVAELLRKAATLPWIDAIMFKYNFRDYGNRELNAAMDACHRADVGLIAMKTQGSAMSFEDRVRKFGSGRFSRPQAVLKAVWEDGRITAAVSHMDTLEKIKANVAAATDKSTLSAADRDALQQYALATQHLYCAGCQHICGQALPAGLQVGTTLRYLMYHDSYHELETARGLFARLPAEARHIKGVDFSRAAALCPNKIDIAKHMDRAVHVLA